MAVLPSDLLVQGRRELVCGEILKAIETFQTVCEHLAKENGDLHESLAEPNLLYGSALLELARMESNVLGNALEGVPEDEDLSENEDFIEESQPMTDAEKDNLTDQVIDAMCDTTKQENLLSPNNKDLANEAQPNIAINNDDSEVEIQAISKQVNEKTTLVQKTVSVLEPQTNENNYNTSKDNVDDKPDEIADNEPKVDDEDKSKEILDNVSKDIVDNVSKDDDNESKKNDDELKENSDNESKEGDDDKLEEDGDEDADEEESEDEASHGEPEENQNGCEDSVNEEVSNFQLAWECIEVAKQIFSKSINKENKLKVADCLEKLAEISREKEDYEKAISDLEESLKIRTELLDEDDRVVAECYYQIGTTYAVSGNLDEAYNSFKKSLSCLESLRAKIIIQLEGTDKSVSNDEIIENLKITCQELDNLIPDIEKRILEIEEDRLEEQNNDQSNETETIVTQSQSTSASDISHLVRRKSKRPAVESELIKETNGHNGLSVTEINGNHSEVEIEKEPVAKKVRLNDSLTQEV